MKLLFFTEIFMGIEIEVLILLINFHLSSYKFFRFKIIYNNNPEKFLNILKVNEININSSSDIWNVE